jgi:VWFA-related protein
MEPVDEPTEMAPDPRCVDVRRSHRGISRNQGQPGREGGTGVTSARASTTLFAVIAALSIGLSALQQPTFRAKTEAVALDVTVVDRDGSPVRGLTTQDFRLFEDGSPQSITTFTAVDLPDVERAGPTPFLLYAPRDVRRNEDVKEGLILVLVLDDAAQTPPSASLRVRGYGRSVVDRLGPMDLAAVVFIANKSAGQEFTRDRSRLMAAVERYGGGSTVGGNPSRDGGSALGEMAPRMVTDTLRSIADGLSSLPQRRKVVVYISVGVPLDMGAAMPQGPTLTTEAMRTGEAIDNLVAFFDLARRANVNVYCLNPWGLDVPRKPGESEVMRLGREFLQTVSQNTGGFTVADYSDPTPGITRMYRENRSYYIIGYQPSNDRRDGRYRKVEVRVSRPGVTVRTRAGYVEPRGAPVAESQTTAGGPSAAITGFLPKADVPMELTVAPFSRPGRQDAALLLVLGVGTTESNAGPAGNEDVEVVMRAYNRMGDLRASGHFTARPKERAQAGAGTLREFVSQLTVGPGQYQVRVAASAAGRSGSVYYDVDVPDFANAPLTLSGLLLGHGGGAAFVAAANADISVPIASTVRREFDMAESIVAFVRVYQGGRGKGAPVSLTTKIENEQGSQVFASEQQYDAARFGSAGSVDHRVELPLPRLGSGRYLLTIEAKLERRTVTRTALFAVAKSG